MYMYLVLNNEFNRRYYPSLIGLRFLNPPIHASEHVSRPVQVRASMGPRSVERGNRIREGFEVCERMLLQWGHAR